MIKIPKISAPQLFVMLLISRMFSIFTYKPLKFNIGFGTATAAILVSAIINILVFIPALIITERFKGRNVVDAAGLIHQNGAKIYSFLILITCIFLCTETLAQFEIFMASTIYITWAPIFLIIPTVLTCAYLCRLGVESLARLSGYVFGGLILSIAAIAIAAIGKINVVWIEPAAFDNLKGFWEYVADNVFHTTEIIPFLFLVSFSKGNLKKGTVFFSLGIAALFEMVSFLVISTLGNYRETVLFPFYTVSAMGQTTLSERFNAAFITLWVFMAVIKICVYLFVSAKALRQIKNFKNDTIPLVTVSLIVIIASLFITEQISYVNVMYSIIVTGIPVILLGVAYPIILLFSSAKKKGVSNLE